MRIALLSDIHANLQALEACLQDAAAQGARRLVFLGDIVGYGADPAGVLARVAALAAQGAVVLRGNHDEAVLTGPRGFTAPAAAAARWTAAQLAPEERAWLAALPLSHAEAGMLFVHGDASEPAEFRYVTDARDAGRSLRATDAGATFCGHTHVPALFRLAAGATQARAVPEAPAGTLLDAGQRWLAVVGAVGQPRDGHPEASYALLETGSGAPRLLRRRVAYDVAAAARAIRAAGLPEILAERLFAGV